MRVLVIGSGGREHALVWKIAQSPRLTKLFCAPGNAGIEAFAQCVSLKADDIIGLRDFAHRERIDLTVVGPEGPLALGIADEFRKSRLRIFGPTRGAAQIEASKSFAKDLMVRHGIPTAEARNFDRLAPAFAYIEQCETPLVVKADGLAQGKGVIIAQTKAEAKRAVEQMLEEQAFGAAGRRVVIEQFLAGDELTIMAFTDGKTVAPMVGAQDHKRVADGDTGPNTGGMGAYAPAPLATPALRQAVIQRVFRPAIEAMARVGSPFYGVLYAGLMVVRGEPYVLEFNARMGDPETQVVLPLLKTDLLDVLEAVVEHRLDQIEIEWENQVAVCVVLTSGGYPGDYTTGHPIHGLNAVFPEGGLIFHAGTTRRGNEVVTAGGRVLGVTARGGTFQDARDKAYGVARMLSFKDCHFRSDIAVRAISAVR